MHKLVERSIALWKAQHGPMRKQIGQHLKPMPRSFDFEVGPEAASFIDYTRRRCDYI